MLYHHSVPYWGQVIYGVKSRVRFAAVEGLKVSCHFNDVVHTGLLLLVAVPDDKLRFIRRLKG